MTVTQDAAGPLRPDPKTARKIVVVGDADGGPSSLTGRLRRDTGAEPPGPARREYVFTVAPGQRELLNNLVGGAASADAAILVIDAAEGVGETARRHGYLLRLLGIRHVVVAIADMDRAGFAEARFAEVAREARRFLDAIGLAPGAPVPVSAREGDNVARPSARMPWYEGPSVLDALDRLDRATGAADEALRFAVQEVEPVGGRRVLAGRIDSGVLRVGDAVLFSPSNKRATVRTIEAGAAPSARREARAGEPVGITLDEALFVEPGEIVSPPEAAPQLTTVFRATVAWLGGAPLETGQSYTLKLATQEVSVVVQAIGRAIDQAIGNAVDPATLADAAPGEDAGRVARDGVAEVVLRSRRMIALDEFRVMPRLGRFVLLDGGETAGAGTISMEGYPDQRRALSVKSTNLTAVEHRIAADARAQRDGHRGGVLWFTGLSGAGKSTLAMEVEQHLFRKGYHVYVLDGDNVRAGLNANLGFSPDDRAENIRRVGEVAALFADAGFICISAFISPYRADRERARRAAGAAFHEIFIDADLATCERRDPKGLYRKARAGQIADFTGVSAPYEAPTRPELSIDTAHASVEDCVRQIAAYVERAFALG